MSFFLQNPTAFVNARKAADNGKLDSFLQTLVTVGAYASGEEAGEAFKAALTAERDRLVREKREKQAEHASGLLAAQTWSKGTHTAIVRILESATVRDPDTGEPYGNVSLTVRLGEEEDSLLWSLNTGSAPTSGKRGRKRSAGSGKTAYLNGEKVTAALLRKHAPGYVATQIMDAKGSPFAAGILKNNGEPYGETSRMDANAACRRDSEIQKLDGFEWRSE